MEILAPLEPVVRWRGRFGQSLNTRVSIVSTAYIYKNCAYTILISGCNLVHSQKLSNYGYFSANVGLGVINEGLNDGAQVSVSADPRHYVEIKLISYVIYVVGKDQGPCKTHLVYLASSLA